MAKKRRPTKRSSSKKWKWASYALMALTTSGGTGGLLLKDHPMLAGIVQAFLGEQAKDKPVGEVLKSELKKAVSQRVAGKFSVTVAKVELGPEVASGKKGPHLQVVVRKVDAQGKEETVWESVPRPAQKGEGGKWSAAWGEDAFEVAWTPGERFLVEVTESQGFFKSSTFAMTDAGSGRSFALGAGAHTLVRAAEDEGASEALGRIVFEAKRTDDLAAAATAHVIDNVPIRR